MKKLLPVITTVILITAYVLAYGAETADQQGVWIVQNSEGEYVGTITKALIDSSGNIRFIIVSIGEKMGEKEIAVPTACFSTNKQRNLLLNVSREKLAEAPEFKVSDLSDPNFAETVYRFFGVMPSWTEEAPRVQM